MAIAYGKAQRRDGPFAHLLYHLGKKGCTGRTTTLAAGSDTYVTHKVLH